LCADSQFDALLSQEASNGYDYHHFFLGMILPNHSDEALDRPTIPARLAIATATARPSSHFDGLILFPGGPVNSITWQRTPANRETTMQSGWKSWLS
jgi:hypothetical protein